MTRVVVVGGGVMGAAAAWQLAERGADVVLLEQFGPGHERGASHGSSRIFRLAYDDPGYVALALRAHDLWRVLEEATGTDVLTITGAVDHGDPVQLAAIAGALAAGGAGHGLLDPADASTRWPGLRFEGDVLWHARAGRLHADRAVAALKQAAAALGAEVHHDVAVADVDGTGVVTGAGDRIGADAVVVAAGGWTRKLLGDRLALPSLHVTVEQPAHFTPLDPSAPWPSFIHHPSPAAPVGPDDAAAYGLGSDDGVKIGFHKVGPEIDPDRADRQIDAEALALLQAYVRRWVPGVDAASAAPLTCTYTLTPDEHAVIDRDGPLTVLAGFSGHGFKFAPAFGALAAGLVLDGDRARPAFALGRRDEGSAPVIR